MSFTFNWAGVDVPVIQGGSNDYQKTIRADAANAGSFARGYEQRKADREYADMLGSYKSTDVKTKVLEMKAEIARLEQRNQEIRKQLGG